MKRLVFMLDALGPLGIAGLGVLLFCLPFYFTALAPAEAEVKHRTAAIEQARQPAANRASDGATEVEQFYRRFPRVDGLQSELGMLYELARAAKVQLLQGEYRLESRAGGLIAYRVSLPVRGNYPQLRQFVGGVLKSMPATSVDALQFERKKPADAEVDAQIRLTIYLRPKAERKGA